jgi:hypothetical protein
MEVSGHPHHTYIKAFLYPLGLRLLSLKSLANIHHFLLYVLSVSALLPLAGSFLSLYNFFFLREYYF